MQKILGILPLPLPVSTLVSFSLPTVSASDYLASHSIRDLERERLLAVLKKHGWHVFSASQELGTKVRLLYAQMERLGIEPARSGTYRSGK